MLENVEEHCYSSVFCKVSVSVEIRAPFQLGDRSASGLSHPCVPWRHRGKQKSWRCRILSLFVKHLVSFPFISRKSGVRIASSTSLSKTGPAEGRGGRRTARDTPPAPLHGPAARGVRTRPPGGSDGCTLRLGFRLLLQTSTNIFNTYHTVGRDHVGTIGLLFWNFN